MHTLRRGQISDIPAIYRLLNVPAREKLLMEPLSAEEEFFEQSQSAMESGEEQYYLLEQNGSAEGLIRIIIPHETCEIWGRALATLYYHCGRIAFEELGMKRLHWNVRQNNRRMIRICKMFGARKTSEAPFFNFTSKFSFLAIGVADFFEFTPESFRNHVPIMQKYAQPLNVL